MSYRECVILECLTLGVVHKLRHPLRGYGGVSQKMTQDDRGVGGGLATDDEAGDNKKNTHSTIRH